MSRLSDALEYWRKDWILLSQFFGPEEMETIARRLREFRPETIVCCSMESRFARSGGLAAVNANSPAFLNNAPGIEAILLTPFHANIIDSGLVTRTGLSVQVEWQGGPVEVRLFVHKATVAAQSGELNVTEYYLQAEGFWEAKNNVKDPYFYTQDTQRNNDLLRRDALFFCKAVPSVARELGYARNVIFHLHEWQTALVSLTAKEALLTEALESCGTVQTMHNPFDSPVGMDDLADLVSSDRVRERIRERARLGGNYGEMTAYAIGLGLVDAPIAVVSEHFAEQFRSDILHTQYYAPHLQPRFAKGLMGINNGPFVPFAKEFPLLENHNPDEVKRIKEQQRSALLHVLDSYHPQSRFGALTYEGGSISKLPADVPIFVMTGRLDPCQRGYDVFLSAFAQFKEDEIKGVLAPMPVNPSDLDYFYEIAAKCNGNLTVFPIRMEQGYRELQCGATFSVWPSIYEPFGGAIEYMANATPVIVRESGGLVNQVDSGQNGIRYLESTDNYTIDNIRGFFAWKDIVQPRKTNPWYRDMVQALKSSLEEGIRIFRDDPDAYHQMILNGFKKAKQFSWEKNTNEYLEIYSMIGRF